MSYTLKNETKYLLPAYECALISTFLDGEEGNFFRKATGDIEIKEVRNGCTYKNGALHSFNNNPAVSNNEKQAWYKDGELHREGDLPALIDLDIGVTSYYINGKLHRDGDNPAVESNSFSQWYKDGLLHRDNDLPAVVDEFQYEWWVNGKRHRDNDKPAFDDERTDTKQWWVNGVLIRSTYFGGDDDISYYNEVNQKWDN